MSKILKPLILCFVSLTILFSCKNEPKFTLSGEIKGAKDTLIYLEKRELSTVTTIDSVKVGGDGKFEFKSPAPKYPELYALRFGNQYINLGVDSIETIVVHATKDHFATDYTVEGSDNCNKIKEITLKNYAVANDINVLTKKLNDKSISDTAFTTLALQSISGLKTLAMDVIVKTPKSLAAYYALFQRINGDLIFDPYDRKESKLYGAVATQWDMNYKESPRAQQLRNFTLLAMKTKQNMEAQAEFLKNAAVTDQSDLLNISLPNAHNQVVNLASFRGKVIVLDFTTYLDQYSPAHNSELNKAYEKFGQNITIYQISFDDNIHAWKNAAINLPWTCVRDDQAFNSKLITLFNIQGLPTTYIVNKQYEIVKRILQGETLEAEIAKVL